MVKYIASRLLITSITVIIIFTLSYFSLSFAKFVKYSEMSFNEYLSVTFDLFKVYVKEIVLNNNWGTFEYDDTIWDEVIARGTISLKFNMYAALFYIPSGVFVGYICAINHDRLIDKILQGFFVITSSIPVFIMMFLLIIYLGFYLGIGHYQYVEAYGLRNYIIPIMALSFAPISIISRVVRAELIENTTADYFEFAVAKGLKRKQVMFRHSIRNSLSNVISVVPEAFLFALVGSAFIEIIYDTPGIAALLFSSLIRLSPMGGYYTYIEIEVVMVILLFYTVLSLGANLLAKYIKKPPIFKDIQCMS